MIVDFKKKNNVVKNHVQKKCVNRKDTEAANSLKKNQEPRAQTNKQTHTHIYRHILACNRIDLRAGYKLTRLVESARKEKRERLIILVYIIIALRENTKIKIKQAVFSLSPQTQDSRSGRELN